MGVRDDSIRSNNHDQKIVIKGIFIVVVRNLYREKNQSFHEMSHY